MCVCVTRAPSTSRAIPFPPRLMPAPRRLEPAIPANGKICPLPSPVSLTKPANRVTSAGLATLTSEFVRRAPACLRKPAVLSPSAGSRALTGSRFSKSLVHDD